MDAGDVIAELKQYGSSERAEHSLRFFKTGPGQYGEGDKFLGVTVPLQRKVAKKYRGLDLAQTKKLVTGSWHEARLTGLLILVDKYKRGDALDKKKIYDFYVDHTKFINNWDLVDSSAGYIVGDFLDGHPEKMRILENLAGSGSIWERRIAMIACFHFILQGSSTEALKVGNLLINDSEDLIQKAVGWMLRETGKRVSRHALLKFLDIHAKTMPRTTLRYAIEHLPAAQKNHYMNLKNAT